MKIECSLCGQQLEKDAEWIFRKKAHEDRHKRGEFNNIIGTVKWITVWE